MTPAVELSWSPSHGSEECIDRATLASKVEQIVGRQVFSRDGPTESVIRGRVGPAPAGAGWLAVIEARNDGAVTLRRELALGGGSCRQLDEAIVLVVALMVDSSEQAAPLALPTPAEPSGVAIGPDVAAEYGMLPGVAVGYGLLSEVHVPPVWPLVLSTHFWPMSEARLDGSGGQLGAWTGALALCPLTWSRPAWAVYGCAAAMGGAVLSSGISLDIPRTNTRPYGQVGLRVGARAHIAGSLFAAVDLEGALPLSRDSYAYAQADGTAVEVFRTAAFVPLVHVRLEIRVP